MAKVEIYTSRTCGYCHAAKRLLNEKNINFIEIDVKGRPETRSVMVQRANGRRTVPQIFIDDQHVGGFDEIHELERREKLDPLLRSL